MFFTNDILDITDACRRFPSVETIALLGKAYNCSPQSIHKVLEEYLPEYRVLFKNLSTGVENRRDLGERPPCPFCGTENPKSDASLWVCKNCKRKWRKKATKPLSEFSDSEKLIEIERRRKEKIRKLKASLKLRKNSGLALGRPPIMSPFIVGKILSLREQGHSYSQISSLVGMCPASCYHVVRKVTEGSAVATTIRSL
jgi:ribosomal protein L37AE/L43A